MSGQFSIKTADCVRQAIEAVSGHIDHVAEGAVEGWVWDSGRPEERLTVQLHVDDLICASAVADLFRADLKAAGVGDGAHGFHLELPYRYALMEPKRAKLAVQGLDKWISYRRQREFLVPAPPPNSYIAADVVNNCNLRCPFCLVDYSEVKKTELMTLETFGRLLKLLPLVGKRSFWLSCLHEPLHPGFESLLRMIAPGEGQKFWYTTNLARRLDVSIFRCWAETGLHHVDISLDTLSFKLFRVLRKNGRLGVFMDNPQRLVRVFRACPGAPKIRYIHLVFESNFEELESILRRCHTQWLSSEHELRYMCNVEHVTEDFRRAHPPTRNRWPELTERLNALGLPHVVAYPPERGYEEQRDLPANYFEFQRYSPQPQPVEFNSPLRLRARHNGNLHLVGQESRCMLDVNTLEDPAANILELMRKAIEQ